MRFTLEAAANVNLIRGYSASEIRIGTQQVHGSCLVTAREVLTDWGPQSFAEFSQAHLAPVLALQPELVLLGTGLTQQFAPGDIRHALSDRQIGLESMQLGAACRTFNVLVQEERRVVAVLFLS